MYLDVLACPSCQVDNNGREQRRGRDQVIHVSPLPFFSYQYDKITHNTLSLRSPRLPLEVALLDRPHDDVRGGGEAKGKLETNITTKVGTAQLADGTGEPDLSHAENGTHDAETESDDGGDARRQGAGVRVGLRAVALESAAEDEVLGQGDALVDGEPVTDDQHEVLQPGLEVVVAGDGDGDVGAGAEEHPDEAGHALGLVGEHLEGQRHGVDVRAVVGDDGEGEHDDAELAKAAERGHEDRGQETTDTRVEVGVEVVGVRESRGHDGGTEELGEDQGEQETAEGPQEDAPLGAVDGLVDGVVSGIRGPASRESVHGSRKGQDGASLGRSGRQGKRAVELARVGKLAEHDQEDDQAGNPRPALVHVHDLVAEGADQQGRDGDDQDAGPARDVAVNSMDQLRADNDVDRGPSNASKNVENSD